MSSQTAYILLKRNEPKEHFFSSLFAFLIVIPGLLTVLLTAIYPSLLGAALISYASYWTLFLILPAAYRLSPFHPLAQYPGPVLAKLTQWWAVYHATRSGQIHLVYQRLHERYGDYVRVGPNELSIRDPASVHAVLGPTGFPKGPYYSNRSNPPMLSQLRGHTEHAKRRQAWNRGFTTSALKGYEDIGEKRLDQLLEVFERKIEQGAILKVSKWLSFFATDFMGDMAFGGGFELLEKERDEDGIWAMFERTLRVYSILAHIPWVIKIVRLLPSTKRLMIRARAFGRARVVERLQLGAGRKDLFYYISGEDETGRTKLSMTDMASDGLQAILGGSDSTATMLTGVFFYLATHPDAYARLQDEIDSAYTEADGVPDATKRAAMPYLNACINETLRLLPVGPSGSPRWVPPGSGPKTIGEHVIPEGTQVHVNTWSIHRDARNFLSPTAFLPARWLKADPNAPSHSHSDTRATVLNPDAFHPFSFGPANCVGKNLALMEMRTVIFQVLHQFRVRALPGTVVSEWEGAVQDWHIVKVPELYLHIEAR
ncbi:high nitrogen upregulated cytochrome P450 monooxygenase 2 [Dentipellis sp. KUC8613]|nr:high nitrogen upregulated cytochrome P450 monooxygenase 2 [Dentipellis sp. KUC8613]